MEMSDDLISRKAVLDILTEERVRSSLFPSLAFVEILAQFIKKLPTAFDKEKVIEKIKCERDEAQDYNQYSAVAAHEIDIEILKKGGIE